LQQLHCNSCIAIAASQQLHCNSCIATAALQQLHCNSRAVDGDEAVFKGDLQRPHFIQLKQSLNRDGDEAVALNTA
jgi:hypothetical protein